MEELHETKPFKFQTDIPNTPDAETRAVCALTEATDFCICPPPEHPQFRAASCSLPMHCSTKLN